MAKISLRMYNREIESLIEQGQRLDEAIAHCRHILQTYPKHLETYRLLGKAYLEAKRYDQAVDIFQRVLVAAPDDFVSHVGMSIIADDKGRLDDAIWHMERAFEVQPSNAAIQGELQRLFGRRDGVEPPKIRLTRGALAHMYMQGELYSQAISEIRAVLAGDPKRTDMQTLLARAYQRNGQKAEATEICSELLSKYPYCLDANRLMAEILPGTQRADSAQEYRQRVVELDPYAAFVQDSTFHSDTVADGVVTVERLEYSAETAEMPPELGIGLETDTTMASRTATAAAPGDLPPWLRGAADEPAAREPVRPAAPVEPDKNDIPEFLRKAGWGTGATEAVEEAASPFEEPPATEPAADAAVEGDLPEWVKALAPSDEDMIPSQMPPVSESDVFQPLGGTEEMASDTPDWLRSLDETETPAEAPAPEAAISDAPLESSLPPAEMTPLPADAPDWLRDLGPAVSPPTPAATPSPDETPDWIKELAGHEIDEPAASVKNESELDWLGELRNEQAAPLESAAEESPDWLKEFGNDLETPMVKPAEEQAAPEASSQAAPEAAVPTAQEPVSPEQPAELGSLGTSVQEQDDAMAWLEALAAKHGAKPEELVTDPNARTEQAPEWVDKAKEIGEQAPEVPQPPPDATGIWLRNLAAEEEMKAEAAAEMEPTPEPSEEEAPVDVFSSLVEQEQLTITTSEPAEERPSAAPTEAAQEEDAGLPRYDDMPAWLSGLTPKPAEPHTMDDAPAWLRNPSMVEPDESEPQPQAQTEPEMKAPEAAPTPEAPRAEESLTDLPAWLAGLDEEETPSAPAAAAQPADELPAWLQVEVEPEPEAKEPAKPSDWHPVQPVEVKPVEPPAPPAPPPPAPVEPEPTRAAEPKPGPAVEAKPAPAPELQPAPLVEPEILPTPVAEVEPERVVEEPAPPPAPLEPAPRPVEKAPPAAPARPRPAAAPVKAAALSLVDAQSQLGSGNISAALDIYGKLIRKGKSLEDIIHDLRDALYRYPVEVPLWQSLGDAYMRANRLQEALDAYTKAEELLR